MKKIIYYKILKFEQVALEKLRENFEVLELRDPSEDDISDIKEVEAVFAPLGFYCGKEKIDKMPLLKVIASNTTGDPHIDVQYAESLGIKVITLKSEKDFLSTITPTAEHTWGLIIALIRNIIPAHMSVMGGVWDRKLFGGKSMLSKMSIGIIGLGRLGSMVSQFAEAFKMPLINYYDPYVTSQNHRLSKCSSLKELVSKSDIVTLHTPSNDETKNLINSEIFNSFRPGSFFINTARAEIVDNDALLVVLKDKRLAGAAIDVFPGEFDINFSDYFKDDPLLQYAKTSNNLIITPHIGGSTLDAWRETQIFTIDKVISYLNGK
ncbi:MAG: hydroxyacid dehydrogenase [Parcubacteria group bacterium CG11_big_fil_rev_8_21_14_0_20_39_22]|nr:MAG: hydroxyacid dehydrogenase [Parcubacteria group bacterium CG11_big_fil_rev_8_21_14_0_20_39_22]